LTPGTRTPTKTLIVVTGPTASGKTALAIEIALSLGCEIISADSRQIYRGMSIGTAAPTAKELAAVRHHFIATLPLDAYYSAAEYESDVLALLPHLWEHSDYAVMCGGSMMYIDAVTRGIDDIPTISDGVRQNVLAEYESHGLEHMVRWLGEIDPESLESVDLQNPRRVVHAIEITLQSGTPASRLRTGRVKTRPWRTVTMAIDYPREQLFDRINRRVDKMIADGLETEAAALYPLRHVNSLNTVGYKEMFAMMDGTMDRDTAIARLAKNTRVYAKKQLTWLKRRPEVHYLDPSKPLLPQALSLITPD